MHPDSLTSSVGAKMYMNLVSDEYVDHIRFIIGGWLLSGNIEAFEFALNEMPEGGAIIEVGSFLGLSTNIIAYGAHKYGRKNPFFNCDPWLFAGRDRPKANYFSTGTQEYRDWVMTIFKMNIQMFSAPFPPKTIEATSDDFFENWRQGSEVLDIHGKLSILGGAISFAYLDGDHTYEGVRKDFLSVDRHLLPGGFILFDDSADQSSFDGIKQFVSELASNPRYELKLKSPNYLFRKNV
jgi:hypothetical protein